MPSKTENQKRLFQFMSERFATQEPFTLAELRTASGFTDHSFGIYQSKQFGTLLVPSSEGKFRVSLAFRRFNTWQKFRDKVVTQTRKLTRSYRRLRFDNVLLFDFFMPLRNEEWLREELDALFFKDSLKPRLKAINQSELEKWFPRQSDEEDVYLEKICHWLSETLIGYSFAHVNGRFKSGELRTRREALEAEVAGTGKYLIDETTAVVRFIFPCGQPEVTEQRTLDGLQVANHAEQIRWFFFKLFVQTILDVVNSEDEVWLLESGMCHRLYVFKAED